MSPHTEFADKKFGRPGRNQVFVSWTRPDQSAGSGTVTGPLTDSLTTVLDRVDASGIERVDSLRVTRLGYAIFSQAEYDRLAAASSDRFAIAGVLPLPFENRVLIAALPDEVLEAESGPFEIRRLDGAGNLDQIIHVRATQRSGTEYSLGVLSDWYVSSFSDRTLHPIARHLLNGTGRPQRLAHFSDIRGGADGALWLNVDAGPALGERAEWYDWLKIGRDGTPSLTVRLPASLQVLEFGANHVIGVLRDALEVETIGVYEFGSFGEAS